MIIQAGDLEPLVVQGDAHIVRALEFAFGKGECDFAILSKSDEIYLQTAIEQGRFVIEKREGDSQAHFEAVRANHIEDNYFSFQEIIAVFVGYYHSEADPCWLEWRGKNV